MQNSNKYFIPGFNCYNEGMEPNESQFPNADPADVKHLNNFVRAAPTAYGPNNADAREALGRLGQASGGIRKGTQMYRALSQHDLDALSGMKVGDSYTLDAPRSMVGSSGLQDIGGIAKRGGTGAQPTNTVASIEAMQDIPGISRVNNFLQGKRVGDYQGLDSEGLIMHGTRLTLQGHTPGTDGAPDAYHLTAWAPEEEEKKDE